MRDMIYLAIGDTHVPFAEYDGDTRAYCRGVQDAFRYLGIDSDVSESIVAALEDKPQIVQKVFLLRVAGLKQRDIADVVGTNQQEVSRCITQRCADVREILRSHVKPQPVEKLADVVVPASLRN